LAMKTLDFRGWASGSSPPFSLPAPDTPPHCGPPFFRAADPSGFVPLDEDTHASARHPGGTWGPASAVIGEFALIRAQALSRA
jgi:hypothetical protein